MTLRLRRLRPGDLVEHAPLAVPENMIELALPIVSAVRHRGDVALREHAERLDGLGASDPIVYASEDLARAFDALSAAQRGLLSRTRDRIAEFARLQRAALDEVEVEREGMSFGHRVHALETAGCYAPGGRFPLPSSVLMTATTARVAGVDTVIVASPRPAPVTLAAAHVGGADRLLAAGGAQAIAALAFGTESIPRCDVVVGPGNVWVTAAKQIVAGQVRIDSLAGPSELVVVVDDASDPALVAADLLAQAEHDPDAVVGVVTLDESIVTAIETELSNQLEGLSTRSTAEAALTRGFAVIVASPDEARSVCDRLAPEHLQWVARGEDRALRSLRHYGGLFLGESAAEVLGDYGAGPNHVLPTGGNARARGGLSVLDFLKVQTWMRVRDREAATALFADVAALAEVEGLVAHARAARRRSKPSDEKGGAL